MTVPFELSSNHLYVRIRINHTRPMWFLFDSAAESTLLDSAAAKSAGVELQEVVATKGSGETARTAQWARNVTLTAGTAVVRDLEVAALDLSDLEAIEGRQVDGILGYNVLGKFVVEIDYVGHVIRLHDPRSFVYRGRGSRLESTLLGSIPHVHGSITTESGESFPVELSIDTGSRTALSFNTPFVDSNAAIARDAERAILAPFGFGLGGATKTRVGRLGSLELGGQKLEQLVVGYSRDEKGSEATDTAGGNIGGDVLRRFKVTFDYSRNVVYLEPNADFRLPFEYDMFGALLMRGEHGFDVFRIVENSPAAAAGLVAGDSIVSVDGTSWSRLTLDELRRSWSSRPGRIVRLVVESNGSRRDVPVTLRRLV